MSATQRIEQTFNGSTFGGNPLHALTLRAGLVAALVAFEAWALMNAYSPGVMSTGRSGFLAANETTKAIVLLILNPMSLAAFLVLFWRQAPQFARGWHAAAQRQPWPAFLLANATIFLALLLATQVLNTSLRAGDFPWMLFVLWCFGAAAALVSLALILAPVTVWRIFVRQHGLLVLGAALVGAFAMRVSAPIQLLWKAMAEWTLWAATALLQLIEKEVSYNATELTLTVGGFTVEIGEPCSGYEGMGLVACFLSLFIFAFRRDLRFPNVLLLLPLGVLVSWLLNIVRIAVLVEIGAHMSPTLAANGFHSNAGWLLFLAIAIGLMVAALNLPTFRVSASRTGKMDSQVRLACALLLPFGAITLGGIISRTLSEDPQLLYPGVIFAALIVMWPFRDIYRRLLVAPRPSAILVGAVIAVAWVATEPPPAEIATASTWLATAPVWATASWYGCRLFGFAVLVPIAEELAFRGYLHRALISRNVEAVGEGAFSWSAFAVSSLLFGIMHERWLSGIVAGALYAVVMYRSNRISDAIAAHMVSNSMIAAWAILSKQWWLL